MGQMKYYIILNYALAFMKITPHRHEYTQVRTVVEKGTLCVMKFHRMQNRTKLSKIC